MREGGEGERESESVRQKMIDGEKGEKKREREMEKEGERKKAREIDERGEAGTPLSLPLSLTRVAIIKKQPGAQS